MIRWCRAVAFPVGLWWSSWSSVIPKCSGKVLPIIYQDYSFVLVNSKTAIPPPGQTPGHLTFLKTFFQIPRYIASLDGQMPHPLELQNPPPSRHAKATVETSSAKFSTTTNFLFSLSSLHILNKGIFHDTGVPVGSAPQNIRSADQSWAGWES